MKFSANRDDILSTLQAIIGVVERRQTMPVLSNVLLELDDNQLRMTGTDLELELRADTLVHGEASGRTTVPARKLHDICRGLPDGSELQFQMDGNRLRVRSGRSKFLLATLPAEEFPAQDDLDAGRQLALTRQQLSELIQRTQFAMAQQDVRFYLNGLYFEFADSVIRSVATDGHRLAMAEVEIAGGSSEKTSIIVPRKGVTELQRLLGAGSSDLQFNFTDNALQIHLGNIRLTSKLIEGRFPDYERVIPTQSDKWVTGDRDELRAALQRAAILSNEKFRGVRLLLEDRSLKLQTHNPEHEEAEEELVVEYVGEKLSIGFNVNYLLDALSALSTEQYSLGLSTPDHSGLLLEPGNDQCKYVIMPMRL